MSSRTMRYVFVFMFLSLHTHKQTTTQHTDNGSSVAGYAMIKEYDGKKERERRKKKEEEEG